MARRSGFTTTEYLTVCAILLVLAAITTAVIVQAKQRAVVTNCQNNLRSICQAVTLYSEDYDGWAPMYATKKRGDGVSVTAPANPEAWRITLSPYIKSNEVFFCPRDTIRGKVGRNFDSTFTSYEAPLAGLGARFVAPGYYEMNVPLALGEPTPYVCDQTWPDIVHLRPQWFISLHGEKGNYALLNGTVKYVEINTGKE